MFDEAVNVSGSWFAISCANTGAHTATVRGRPPPRTARSGVRCERDRPGHRRPAGLTGLRLHVLLHDLRSPTLIHDIQGAGHISPKNGTVVLNVNGIVTAKRTNGFYMQDPAPDADEATSEGTSFMSSVPTVSVGDAVSANGTVSEFRPSAPRPRTSP
jgi:hypothetical protein